MKVQVPSYSGPASVNSTDASFQTSPAPTTKGLPTEQAVAKTQKPEAKAQAAQDREDLDKIVGQMNKTLEVYNYDLKFEIVDKHRIVISVINTSTGEVLKQIPPEDLIKSFKQMDEFLGMLVDRKV
jgi:flagellar protein FlaG